MYAEFLVLERHKLYRCNVLQLQVKEDCPFKELITFNTRSFKSIITNGFNKCKEYISNKINELLHFINIFRHIWISALKFVSAFMAILKIHTGQTSIWHNILRMKHYLVIHAISNMYNISCYTQAMHAKEKVEKILKKKMLVLILVLSVFSISLVFYDIYKLKKSHITQTDYRREVTKTVFGNLVEICVGAVTLLIRQVAFAKQYSSVAICFLILGLARYLSVVVSGSCFDQYVKNGFLDFIYFLIFLGVFLYYVFYYISEKFATVLFSQIPMCFVPLLG